MLHVGAFPAIGASLAAMGDSMPPLAALMVDRLLQQGGCVLSVLTLFNVGAADA